MPGYMKGLEDQVFVAILAKLLTVIPDRKKGRFGEKESCNREAAEWENVNETSRRLWNTHCLMSKVIRQGNYF